MTIKNMHRAQRRPVLVVAVVSVMTLVLTGCGDLLSAGPPPTFYTLSPKNTFDQNLPDVPWQLVVEHPLSSGTLATQRIALTRDPIQIEYFAGARWTEQAPRLVQTLLVESFENSGKIIAVGRMAIGLRSDYNLKSELREFQAEYDKKGEPPSVRVRINSKMILQAKRQIIASRTFESVVRADTTSMRDVVRAFDRALGKVIKKVVAWTLITGHNASVK
jgi:cholesterol transport system auxiliary component